MLTVSLRVRVRCALPAVAAGLSLACAGVRSAGAQAITLPTARAVGPSAAVKRLVQLVDATSNLYSPTTETAKYDVLSVVRYRLLLAPFTQAQLENIAGADNRPTKARIWAELYAKDIQRGQAELAVALRRTVDEIRAPGSAEADAVYIEIALTGLANLPPNTTLAQYIADRRAAARAIIAKAPNANVEAAIRSVFRSGCENQQTQTPPCVSLPTMVSEEETTLLPAMLAEMETKPDIKAVLDTLGRTALAVVLERETSTWWFPVRSTAQGEVFWKQQGWSPLNIASINAGKTSTAAFTELASPLLNGVRLSLSSVVAAGKSSNANAQGASTAAGAAAAAATTGDESAVSQFLSGGGQANIGAAWPLLARRWEQGDVASIFFIAPRVGGTLTTVGTVQQDPSAFVDPGLEWHGAWVDGGQGTGLFLQSRASYAIGGKSFLDGMGASHNFWYGTFAGGLMFGGKFLITANRVLGGPSSLLQSKWQIGVTTTRGPQ
jgi:hypothetical protein